MKAIILTLYETSGVITGTLAVSLTYITLLELNITKNSRPRLKNILRLLLALFLILTLWSAITIANRRQMVANGDAQEVFINVKTITAPTYKNKQANTAIVTSADGADYTIRFNEASLGVNVGDTLKLYKENMSDNWTVVGIAR